MRISTAYFAGVGTVIVAVAAGLGGGYLAANIANPPPGVSKLERRMSAEPISVAAAPAQPAPRATSPTSAPTQERPQTVATAAPSDAAIPVPDTVHSAQHQSRGREARAYRRKARTQYRCRLSRRRNPLRLIEPNRDHPTRKSAPRARRSQGPATPTLNARMRKSAASNGVRPGLNGAAFSDRVSRNSKQLKRGSGSHRTAADQDLRRKRAERSVR